MDRTVTDVISQEVGSEQSQRLVASPRLVHALLLGVYTSAIFVGASLIFLVQPMVARMALPLFGGSPAVWNTSMVFFQALLLGGYAYAHLSTRALGLRRQSWFHLGVLLLPLLAMPIHLRQDSALPDGISPALWLFVVLLLTAGLPYFVVSTASPILQRWFSGVNHPNATDPYFLYAASNAGSLLALLSYPVAIEPYLTLDQQGQLWTILYITFLALCGLSALLLHRYPNVEAPTVAKVRTEAAPIAWSTRLRWVFLAFVPSSLMVGATGFLSTDVASTPFLWILPLSIYLLTFILAFARKRVISLPAISTLLAVTVVAVALLTPGSSHAPVAAVIVVHLVLLFAAAMLAHTRLADQRPDASRLTEFYLLMSVGGVLGGAFNALVAPVVFDSMLEYPLVIGLALLLRPGPHRSREGNRYAWALDFVLPTAVLISIVVAVGIVGSSSLALMAGALVLIVFVKRPVRFAVLALMLLALGPISAYSALHSERTFFGIHKVMQESGNRHVLAHGTTVHGMQDFSTSESRLEPLTYFTRVGPVGQVFDAMNARAGFDEIAIIGLGAGSMAAFGQEDQTITFFEIDPSVVRIAENTRYFTFLEDTQSDVRMIVGDGRLKLQDEQDGRYDLVVIDAFSSDSIPVHLLTVEAIELYLDKLGPDGVIAMHISNRNLELEPVVAAIASELGLVGVVQREDDISPAEVDAGRQPSHWVVLARTPVELVGLEGDARWRALEPDGTAAWTDDFSNILTTVKWFK
jgi:hypothetical protein